ncbi:MAG: M15 family metallopeptidase, partial [Clostridiales bacterium]
MARELILLHPNLQILAKKLEENCLECGLKIRITETLRTKEEQNDLYARGRTKPGNVVTNVKYPNSFHCWGVAFDICRNDGKGAYKDSDGFFDKVGNLGKTLGLTWGGDWKSIVDKPHFQLDTYGATASKLIQRYGTPENFMAAWPAEKENVEIKKIGVKLPNGKSLAADGLMIQDRN